MQALPPDCPLLAQQLASLSLTKTISSLDLRKTLLYRQARMCLAEPLKGEEVATLPLQLTKLTLTTNSTWTSRDLVQLAASQTALVSLDLSGCLALTFNVDANPCPARTIITSIGSLSQLTALSVARSDITDLALELLSQQARCLRFINLRGCAKVTEVGLWHLVYSLPTLEKVFIDHSPMIHRSVSEHLAVYEPAQETLKLDLSEPFHVTTHQIIFKRYSKWRFLLLDKCADLTSLDTVLQAIDHGAKKRITVLHLKDFGFNDVLGLRKVKAYLPSLPKLFLQGALMQVGLYEVGRHFPDLVKFVVKPDDSQAIGEEALIDMMRTCTKLTELGLCNFSRLTPVGIRRILGCGCSLRKLTVRNCSQIDEAALTKLRQEFQSVTID